jgi:Tol biopolymer transport system component
LSRNGRWLVFASRADHLVIGDVDGSADLFLADLEGGGLLRLVRPATGAPLLGSAQDESTVGAAVSDDGERVVFDSARADLVAGGSGGRRMFLLDRAVGELQQLCSPVAGRAESSSPSLSADGRVAAFLQSGILRVLEFGADGALVAEPTASLAPIAAGHAALSPDGHAVVLTSATEFAWLPGWVAADVSVPYLLRLPELPQFRDGFEPAARD